VDKTRLEITGRGLKPQFKLETDPFEAGELHVNCTLIPLFAREKKERRIERKECLPVTLQLPLIEDQSQMVSCDVRNAKNDMSVLSKPLNMVVSPQVTEMEVVFLCV
jgi:hypothetical protein